MIDISEKESRLLRDCNIIVEGILSSSEKPPIAILLCGGYGRDEGAWYIDEGCLVSPYNDYDIAVITDKPLDNISKNKLRKELALKVGIKWVDIDYYSLKQMKELDCTVHNIDLIYASKIIYGDDNCFANCPLLLPSKIKGREVVKLYLTRMWTFLGSWEGVFRNLEADEAMFFRNQMAKAVLAGCDMWLIKNHLYNISYKQRSEIVCRFIKNDKYKKMISWAYKNKTIPELKALSKEEMESLYWDVKDFFCNSFIKASSFIDKQLIIPDHFDTFYYIKKHLAVIKFISLFSNRFNNFIKTHDVYNAQIYTFLANNHGSINYDYLRSASSLLRKWGYINEEILDWNQLRIIISSARNNI